MQTGAMMQHGATVVAETDALDTNEDVLRALSGALAAVEVDERIGSAMVPSGASAEQVKILGSIRAMAAWLAGQAGWTPEQLRTALRCTLSEDPNDVLRTDVRRLRRCEDFILSICESVDARVPQGPAGYDPARRSILFASDLFVLVAWRAERSRRAGTAMGEDQVSAYDCAALDQLPRAYRAALSQPDLIREFKRLADLDGSLRRMRSTASPEFVARFDAFASRLERPIETELILAERGVSSLVSEEAAKDAATLAAQITGSPDNFDLWDVAEHCARMHNTIYLATGDDRDARAAAMAAASNLGCFFDLSPAPMTGRMEPLLRSAYLQALSELRSEWKNQSARDLDLTCIIRTSMELYRLLSDPYGNSLSK